MTIPELRAEPIQDENPELKKPTEQEVLEIRKKSGVDMSKEEQRKDPEKVMQANKAWAEHYKGQGHPLADKILDFSDKEQSQSAFDNIKSIQRQLKVKEDGIIGYNTIKAYNEMLERIDGNALASGTDPNIENSFTIVSDLQSIDALGKEETEKKNDEKNTLMENHYKNNDGTFVAEDLPHGVEEQELQNFYETKHKEGKENETKELTSLKEVLADGMVGANQEGYEFGGTKLKTTQLPGGEIVFEGIDGDNKGSYLNTKTGEFETKDDRTTRLEGEKKEKTEYYKGLKERMEKGEGDLRDAEGTILTTIQTESGEKYLQRSSDGKILNFDNGEYEAKDDQTTRLEGEKKEKTEYYKNLEEKMNSGNTDIRTMDGTILTIIQTESGEKYAQRSSDGGILNFSTGEFETKDEKKNRTEGEQSSADVYDLNNILKTYGSDKDFQLGFGNDKKVEDMELGELSRGYDYNTGQIPANGNKAIKKLDEKITPLLQAHPELAKLTVKQFHELRERPELFAKSDIVPKDGTPIDPNEYGIKSDFKYARDGVGNRIKMPVGEKPTMNNIIITDVDDGQDRSQRTWIERQVGQDSKKTGTDYKLPGSPDLMFQKGVDGGIVVFQANKDREIMAEYKKESNEGSYAWKSETAETGTTLASNN
ncbi:hypothetical protein KBB89_00205 [Candidatus Gracilibacteria bacterium]|nr:hypothetical protein [Candidatus Gracilibacteria bacterium]